MTISITRTRQDTREAFFANIDAQIASADPVTAQSLRLARDLMPIINEWLNDSLRTRHMSSEAMLNALVTAYATTISSTAASLTSGTDTGAMALMIDTTRANLDALLTAGVRQMRVAS